MYSCISKYYEVVRRENNLDLLATQNLTTTKEERKKKLADVNVGEL